MPNLNVALCPFYITHSIKDGPWRHEITCENIKDNLGFEMKNTLRFLDRKEINAWMEMFCSDYNYCECEYYKVIKKKYEEVMKNENTGKKIKKRKTESARTGKTVGNP